MSTSEEQTADQPMTDEERRQWQQQAQAGKRGVLAALEAQGMTAAQATAFCADVERHYGHAAGAAWHLAAEDAAWFLDDCRAQGLLLPAPVPVPTPHGGGTPIEPQMLSLHTLMTQHREKE